MIDGSGKIFHTVRAKIYVSRLGIPEVVHSDNNLFISAEILNFSRQFDFKLMSRPHYPKSNGEAERTIKTVKDFLQKSKDPS